MIKKQIKPNQKTVFDETGEVRYCNNIHTEQNK